MELKIALNETHTAIVLVTREGQQPSTVGDLVVVHGRLLLPSLTGGAIHPGLAFASRLPLVLGESLVLTWGGYWEGTHRDRVTTASAPTWAEAEEQVLMRIAADLEPLRAALAQRAAALAAAEGIPTALQVARAQGRDTWGLFSAITA